MIYSLDTNICISILKNKPPEVEKKFRSLQVGDIGISSLVHAELQYGVDNSTNPKKHQSLLDKFLLPLEVLPFGKTSVKAYGKLKSDLRRSGNLIGELDMLIAAHSLSEKLILVTNNRREFDRIPGLKLENWLKEESY